MRDDIKEKFGITSCPNPEHPFSLGKFTGIWQWASDYWADLSPGNNTVNRYYICFRTTVDSKSDMIYTLIIGKLIISYFHKKD